MACALEQDQQQIRDSNMLEYRAKARAFSLSSAALKQRFQFFSKGNAQNHYKGLVPPHLTETGRLTGFQLKTTGREFPQSPWTVFTPPPELLNALDEA
ncbi:hypothetical protein AOLI_G00141140 [Acnodon oligacanthus]